MAPADPAADDSPKTTFGLLTALARDRMVLATLALAAAGGLLLAGLPALRRGNYGALMVLASLLVLVLISTWTCRSHSRRQRERHFWQDLTGAYGLWLGIALLLLAAEPYGVPLPARLAAELATAGFYVLFVRAVESQPHRHGGRLSESVQRLNLAAIVLFVSGLLTYFWLIPGLLQPGGGERNLLLPSVYLYATLDILLTVRLLLLARAAGSPHWRWLYSLLALTTASMLAGDLAGSIASFTEALYFYSASMVAVIVAARSELLPSGAYESDKVISPDDSPNRGWQTVIYLLVLPLVDLLVNRFELLNPAGRFERATVVLIWMPLLAGVALLQNRQLERERRRVLAELHAKNDEMERFAYTVSHDLKAPLITVQGFLSMLEKDLAAGKTERVASDIERIRNAAGSMGRLIHDLLELSQVGRVVNQSEEVSLGGAAGEAVELLNAEIRERGVEVEVSQDLPVVMGDRARLIQVFQNLVDNAVKYMGSQGDPRITISSRRQNGEAVYYVRDNGAGIEPRHQAQVFELFSRLETGTDGSGVGLALVQRIVESHHGRIWVESEGRGRGSTFCFTLG